MLSLDVFSELVVCQNGFAAVALPWILLEVHSTPPDPHLDLEACFAAQGREMQGGGDVREKREERKRERKGTFGKASGWEGREEFAVLKIPKKKARQNKGKTRKAMASR